MFFGYLLFDFEILVFKPFLRDVLPKVVRRVRDHKLIISPGTETNSVQRLLQAARGKDEKTKRPKDFQKTRPREVSERKPNSARA